MISVVVSLVTDNYIGKKTGKMYGSGYVIFHFVPIQLKIIVEMGNVHRTLIFALF